MSHGRQHRGKGNKTRSVAEAQASQLVEDARQRAARREATAARRVRRSSIEKVFGAGRGDVFFVQDADDNITMIRIEKDR